MSEYPLTDALGSVYATTDSAGAVAHRYDYDVWGVRTDLGGSGPGVDFGYTGQRHDANGVMGIGDRPYLPQVGRWLQPDRAGMVDGPSLYQYVRSSPALLKDPSGALAVLLGTSVLHSAYSAALATAAEIATFAAFDFVSSGDQQIPYSLRQLDPITYYRWEPNSLDWSTIGFVPVVQLEIDCEPWTTHRGVTPFFLGSQSIRTIKINPPNILDWPAPAFASTILHEWVHASIQNWIAESANPVAARAQFDARASAPMNASVDKVDTLSEIIAYTIQWRVFPYTRPP